MKKIVVLNRVSIDGFFAGPNGEMDWISLDDTQFDLVGKMTDEADTALYGRKTYEMMEGYWPTAADQSDASKHDIEHSAWYKKAHKLVLSKTIQGAGLTNTTIISNNIATHINEIKQREGSEILLFGSPTATHSLIKENLIDGYWLFVNPIILGEGIPLFKDIKDRVKLNLLTSTQFSNGVTELSYLVEK